MQRDGWEKRGDESWSPKIRPKFAPICWVENLRKSVRFQYKKKKSAQFFGRKIGAIFGAISGALSGALLGALLGAILGGSSRIIRAYFFSVYLCPH